MSRADFFAKAMNALPVGTTSPFVVGFSGGGDSLALLALTCRFAQNVPVHALIVDHGLRANSAQEAQTAAHMAQALGAHPQVLRWHNPRAGQNRARQARYALLAEACRALKAKTVLLAHTQDDQEETFVIRLGRNSSVRGLACMSTYAPLPVWPEGHDLALARPVLGFRRKELRQYLAEQNLHWIDDPSNEDRHYARVRARQHLAGLYKAGMPVGRIARSVGVLGALENEFRQQARTIITHAVRFFPAGFAHLDKASFAAADQKIRNIALGAVLAGVSGKAVVPVFSGALHGVFDNLSANSGTVFSAGGCRIACGDETICISRDSGAVLGRHSSPAQLCVDVQQGQTVLFDARFQITAPNAGVLEALGARAKALPAQQQQALYTLPAPVRPLVPVIRNAQGQLQSPVLEPIPGVSGTSQFLGVHIIDRILAPISHINAIQCD